MLFRARGVESRTHQTSILTFHTEQCAESEQVLTSGWIVGSLGFSSGWNLSMIATSEMLAKEWISGQYTDSIRETYYNLKYPWHPWLSLTSVTAIKFVSVRQSLFLGQTKTHFLLSYYSSHSTADILLIFNNLFFPYLH